MLSIRVLEFVVNLVGKLIAGDSRIRFDSNISMKLLMFLSVSDLRRSILKSPRRATFFLSVEIWFKKGMRKTLKKHYSRAKGVCKYNRRLH